MKKTPEDFYCIAGTRGPLAALAYATREGESPESIHQDLPALSLKQAFGAMTFCLVREATVAVYLERLDRHFEQLRRSSPLLPTETKRRLAAARAARTALKAQWTRS